MSDKIRAPWTPEQVAALNRWQAEAYFHPFTCACGTVLRATEAGWVCDDIGCPTDEELERDGHPRVVQLWAHSFMLEEPPKHPFADLPSFNSTGINSKPPWRVVEKWLRSLNNDDLSGFGGAKGLIDVSDDFDAPLSDFED